MNLPILNVEAKTGTSINQNTNILERNFLSSTPTYGYTPEVNINGTAKLLLLPFPRAIQTHENGKKYGCCWAASLANILAYRNGGYYSPFAICDRMGIAYSPGATIDQIKKAFRTYGLSGYHTVGNQYDFDNIKRNIDGKWPIMAIGEYAIEHHALTLIGYNDASKKLVYFHDSYDDGAIVATYKSRNMTIPTNNFTFTWYESFAEY